MKEAFLFRKPSPNGKGNAFLSLFFLNGCAKEGQDTHRGFDIFGPGHAGNLRFPLRQSSGNDFPMGHAFGGRHPYGAGKRCGADGDVHGNLLTLSLYTGTVHRWEW